jgi:hypothetical protein
MWNPQGSINRGRPRNSWQRCTLAEAAKRSWREEKMEGTCRQPMFLMERWTLLLLLLLLLFCTQKLNHIKQILLGQMWDVNIVFSILPYITPLKSHMPIMQLTNALSYTSNGIMKLHDTVLATGKLGVDFY